MARALLTDSLARKLTAACGSKITYDAGPNRIPGLGLRVSATSKSWVLGYSVGGRERRIVIGSYPAWDVKKARARAAELRRLVDQGRDPLAERDAERRAPNMAALLDDYIEHIRTTKRSWRSTAGIIAQYLRPRWGSRKVGSITRAEIAARHREISKATPIRANRVLAALSAVFAFAIQAEIVTDNPCRNVKRNPENRRERYLTAAELVKLMEVLRGWPDPVESAAVRLLLLTGCRRGELLGARWGEFDLINAVWVKPADRTKAKRVHRVPLSAEAIAVLLTLPRHADTDLLFRNTANRRHWSTVRDWPAIRDAAGLKEVHLHDLRHTAASLMVSSNVSLAIVGGMLGHSQPSTTAQYAHLMDGSLRAAVDGLGRAVGGTA